MYVEVTVNERRATRMVERLSRRLSDGTPQLRSLVDIIIAAQQVRYAGRGIAGSGYQDARWKKAAKSTRRKDALQGRDPRMLILTGELMRSLTVRGHPKQVVRINRETLRFGTSVHYARFHHRGKGVPKRAVVGLSRVQRAQITQELTWLLVGDTRLGAEL